MFIIYVVISCCLVMSAYAYVTRMEQCQPIEIPRCQTMPYNMTQMPNLMHHNTQENARLVFQKFDILIDQHCSDVLLFFLCSLYVPICAVALQPEAIPPCRSVCEKARGGCEPLMNAYNVSWPDSLQCSRLPSYERGVCVSPEAFVIPSKRKGCNCTRKKPTLQALKKHNYHYAVRARVLRKTKLDDKQLLYKVRISQIIFCGKVKVPTSHDILLWSNSSCPCPKMRKGRDYLVVGHEDRLSNKLMVNNVSVAVKWHDSWPGKIRKLLQRLQVLQLERCGGIRFGENLPITQRERTGKRGGRKVAKEKPEDKVGPTSSAQQEATVKEDLSRGYTHGGRYYTKQLSRLYSWLSLQAYPH